MKFFWSADQHGQAMAEAALIIPILLLLLLGIFTVGYWFNARQTVTAAAREGARAAALTGACDQVSAAVFETANLLDKNAERFTVGIFDSDKNKLAALPPRGMAVTVQVVYQIPIIFDFIRQEYARSNKNLDSVFPFSEAQGRATARMEVDGDGTPCSL